MKRREFILKSILGTFGLYAAGRCGSGKKTIEDIYPPSFEPGTADEKTMAALADTVLPGYDSDPEGAPGALEAGALIVLFDKSNPAHQFIPLISALLNNAAETLYNMEFYELNLDDRTTLLENVEGQLSYISLLTKFIKGAFYAAFVNDVGYKYMDYPGANLGYREKDFSFDRKMSEELTIDGSLP